MIQMPCLRQCARIASWASRSTAQPVGLFGELIITARVPGSSALKRRSASSFQPVSPNCSPTRTTSAPRILGISVRLGHSGVTHTTRSPGLTSASTASISAFIPDEVTATLPAASTTPVPVDITYEVGGFLSRMSLPFRVKRHGTRLLYP